MSHVGLQVKELEAQLAEAPPAAVSAAAKHSNNSQLVAARMRKLCPDSPDTTAKKRQSMPGKYEGWSPQAVIVKDRLAAVLDGTVPSTVV